METETNFEDESSTSSMTNQKSSHGGYSNSKRKGGKGGGYELTSKYRTESSGTRDNTHPQTSGAKPKHHQMG